MQIDTTQVHQLPKSGHLITFSKTLLTWVLKINNIQPTFRHTLIILTTISPGYIHIPDKSAMCTPKSINSYFQISCIIPMWGQFFVFRNNHHFWIFEIIIVKTPTGSRYYKEAESKNHWLQVFQTP
jgi:hypothetical protein